MTATDYNLVPLLLPSGREDAEHRVCVRQYRAIDGLMTTNGGIEWFDIGDPFSNKLSLLMGRCGDDYAGTLLYAGLPMMMVIAGGTRGDAADPHGGQYESEFVRYNDESLQEICALFHENVVGDMPGEGSDEQLSDDWPFDHAASCMVHEEHETVIGYSHRIEGPIVPVSGRRKYDLWDDLMEHSGSQGYEITEMTGYVAHSMWRWGQLNEARGLPEPRGF